MPKSSYDVVICGAGLAGLTLALQLRQEHPWASVLLLERTQRPLPDACHKVGESSVELGSQYLERLGLREYLLERHIIKHGLRFFPGGGTLPLEQRTEIGPMQEPIVNSYQLDRGIFESDMRARVEQAGVELIEGASVKDVHLESDETPHRVSWQLADGRRGETQARWVVDATGRSALLRRRLKLSRGTRHQANAGWFRIDGRFDINALVSDDCRPFHDINLASERWRSTNHFMGEGYWAWVIPLSSGKTSIGLVVHDAVHGFDVVRTEKAVRAFLLEHEPVLGQALAQHAALDFLCLRNYSHNVGSAWSANRWGMVGEAGAFVDPLYSPGTDFIAFANSFTSELIGVDHRGEDLAARARELSLQYRALVVGNIEVYRAASSVYGHPQAMLAKIYWDNLAYWSYPCQYFLQGLFRHTGEVATAAASVGQRFVELSGYVQAMLQAWAELAPGGRPDPGLKGMPRFPSVIVDAHLKLQERMDPPQTLAYMRERAQQGEQIVGELLLHVLGELSAEQVPQLIERARVALWDIGIERERVLCEASVGLARRKQLSDMARDVERSLGRGARQHEGEALLGWLPTRILRGAGPEAAATTAS